jgi:hypothetical protein
MTYNKKIFHWFQEQEGGMCVELQNDATYPVKGLGSIYFQMPSGDDLELDSLYVPDSTKSLLSISCRTNLQCLAEFDCQQITIRDNSHGSGQLLSKGVQEGGLYKLLVDPVEQVLAGCRDGGGCLQS